MKAALSLWVFFLLACIVGVTGTGAHRRNSDDYTVAAMTLILDPILFTALVLGVFFGTRYLVNYPWSTLKGSSRLCVALGVLWSLVVLPLSTAWLLNGAISGAAGIMGAAAAWLAPIAVSTLLIKLTAWVAKGFSPSRPS